MSVNIQLVPSYENCFVLDTQDALLLIQAAIDNIIPVAERRPQDSERPHMIKHGNVFIFDENGGHLQRWTDGMPWSPSRILSDFLIYREKNTSSRLSNPSTARRSSRSGMSGAKWGNSGIRKIQRRSQPMYACPTNPQKMFAGGYVGSRQITEYDLYGSLTDGPEYKAGGLMKRTISVPFGDASYRLVAYYIPEEVMGGSLRLPSEDPMFSNIEVNPDLAVAKNVKVAMVLSSVHSPRSSISSYSSVGSRSSMGSVHSRNSIGSYSAYPPADAYTYGSVYQPRYSVESDVSSRDSTARYSGYSTESGEERRSSQLQEWFTPFASYTSKPAALSQYSQVAPTAPALDPSTPVYYPGPARPLEPAMYEYDECSARYPRRYSESESALTSSSADHTTVDEHGTLPSLFKPTMPKHPLSSSSSGSSPPGMSASLISSEGDAPDVYNSNSIKLEEDDDESSDIEYEEDTPIFSRADLGHAPEEVAAVRR